LDVAGIWLSAALFALLHSGRGLWAWASAAFLFGLLFGAMVENGFGLLSVTVAHALVNYLSLVRMVLR
jgi:membrane protease YdiL (CAAX protease family)